METTNAVAASNALTARWAEIVDGATVLSGLGVWPLLALLVNAADGPARDELAAAVGKTDGAGDLFGQLASAPAIHTALGLWTHKDLPLNKPWLDSLPETAHELLSGDVAADKRALDEWTRKHTDELVQHMPIQLGKSVLLVLASALAVRTEWVGSFTENRLAPDNGPWAGRELTGLRRNTPDIDDIGVIAGTTLLRVPGDDDIDVHLVLGGPDTKPGDVLAAGIQAIGQRLDTGSNWRIGDSPGPGIEVAQSSALQRPTLSITTCRFTVTGSHNLLERPDLFGLRTASDCSRGHFPGISPVELCISEARQNAIAIFTATGFKAAAVTAMGMRRAAMVRTAGALRISVTFDRPYGFVAVHRPTGLVLVAGWVADPDSYS
jgi:serine protease inhibitor